MDETTLTYSVRLILKCTKRCVRWIVVPGCFDDCRNGSLCSTKGGERHNQLNVSYLLVEHFAQ